MPTLSATSDIRGEIIYALKHEASVTALVPAARIFPQQVPSSPEWPYIHLGAPIATPVRADCLDGRAVRVAIHAYALGEHMADDIADAIAAFLDGSNLSIGINEADINWISNTTIRDPYEAGAFHSICQVEIQFAA